MKSINEFLSEVNYKDVVNLSEYVYEHYLKDIKKLDELIDIFEAYLKWDFISTRTLDISKLSSNKNYKDQYDKAAGILKPNIDNLIDKEVEERDFYANIWKTISNPTLFATDDDKIGALIFLENCEKIPYFKLDKPLEVAEKDFNEMFDKLSEDIQKCIFIFNRGYEFRTDVASQLLRLIENQKNETAKVVLLARILHYVEWVFTDDEDEEEKKD